jgi:hypothetical protein
MEGRTLTLAERRVVEEEAYVDGIYLDTKNIATAGVGQTGDYQDMSFDETFKAHEEQAKGYFKDWDTYPEDLQAELIVLAYRGDLGYSKDTRDHIIAGRWQEASVELLDNDDYRASKKGNGAIAGRLEDGARMLAKHGRRVKMKP